MQTFNQVMMITDFNRKARRDFIKQSFTRRLRFWWHYFKSGYSVKAAWLMAGGR